MTVYEVQMELRAKVREFKRRGVSRHIINHLNAAVHTLTVALNAMEHEAEKIEPGIYG